MKTKTLARLAPAAALALCVGAAALASGLPAQYASTPTAKDYPAADVLVLSDVRAVTLQPDGRVVEKVSRVEKMLTYQGMDEAGDPKIAFDKENQELTITRCRTYSPEGLVVDAKANSFNEMTPFELEGAPDYTDWRQMVVTKVGLDINAVVEFDYTIADKKPWRTFLDGAQVLRGEDPCLLRQVAVSVPQGMDLHYQLLNASAQPEVKNEGGATVYTWTLKDVPLARLQGTGERDRSFLPTLLYTTCPDWGHWTSILGGRVEKAAAEVSPALQAKTSDLVKGTASDFQKLVKLQEYVASSINDVHWPVADFDFAPRKAAAIYDSGYGHALDKAVLFKAMAKLAGLPATVCLGGFWPQQAGPNAACLSVLPHALVQVQQGKDRWLFSLEAPLAESSRGDTQQYAVLPLAAGAGEPYAVPALEYPDTLSASLDVKLAADLSFEGEGTFTLDGAYAPYFRLQGSDEAVKTFAGDLVRSVLPGAEVTGQSVVRMDPAAVGLKVSFKGPSPGKEAPKALVTGLPEDSLLCTLRDPAVSERDLPVVLPGAGAEKLALHVALDPKLKVLYLPKAAKVENAAGAYEEQWTKGEGSLDLTLTARVPARVVPASAFGGWRDLCGSARSRAQRTVLFE